MAHVPQSPRVGALTSLAPTADRSGTARHRELGMNKAGNRWVRAVAIEGAWAWLRYQPQSELSQRFQRRFAAGGSRLRRIGIVALARNCSWRWRCICERGQYRRAQTFRYVIVATGDVHRLQGLDRSIPYYVMGSARKLTKPLSS